METLIIRGGRSLHGSVELSGAKNAALPIIVGATLAGEKVYLKNVPLGFEDLKILLAILQEMGANIKSKDRTLLVDGSSIHSREAPVNYQEKLDILCCY